MVEWLKKLRQYLLTGVSFAIPFIACGGILIAAAIAFTPIKEGTGPDFAGHPTQKLMLDIGVASFTLMLPVLAGYISYAIAGKPGLVAGMIGGLLSGGPSVGGINAGFIGALIAGLIAGYVVHGMKQLPVPKFAKPIMPIMVIPIVSSLVVGILMLLVIGKPIAEFNHQLQVWLQGIGTGNRVLLGMILGAMIAFDMGGPVNKAAFFFGSGLISQGNYTVMGAVAAAICVPPLGLGLATFIARKQWREEDREAGVAAFAMGFIGITEGAIPFAASDPLRVIPCIMVGSMVASTTAMLLNVGDHAPHGGPIVIPVVDNPISYVIAIVAGTVVTAVLVNVVKAVTKPKAVPEIAEY